MAPDTAPNAGQDRITTTAARSSDGGDLHEGYDGYYEGREPLSATAASDDFPRGPVRPDEVYGFAVEAWNRLHHSGWQWSSLTSGERDEWLQKATPIIRAVLETQRGL